MKTLTEEQFDNLESCFHYADGEDIMSYSGRCMYGEQCLGVTFSGWADAFNFAMLIGTCDEALVEMLSHPSYDSMGRGIVVYWPRIAVPNSVIASEAADDEDAFV
jgi:hypothetical protein